MNLPGILKRIADVAGVDAALAVAKARGGTRGWFCAAPDPKSNWLVDLVGLEKALLIGQALTTSGTSEQFDIPLGPTGSYLRDQQRRAIVMEAAVAGGLGTEQATRAAGVHRSTMKRFKKRRAQSANAPQMKLL